MKKHTDIILKTEDLCKYYGTGDNQVKAVDHVNIEIRQGEFVSIVGKSGSGKKVQIICNAYNYQPGAKKLFADLKVDGAIGPKTLAALKIILANKANAESLVHALNCMQGAHYLELAAKKFTQRKYTVGWMKRTHCEA